MPNPGPNVTLPLTAKVVVLTTDGNANDLTTATVEAEKLRSQGTYIYGLGLGPGLDMPKLCPLTGKVGQMGVQDGPYCTEAADFSTDVFAAKLKTNICETIALPMTWDYCHTMTCEAGDVRTLQIDVEKGAVYTLVSTLAMGSDITVDPLHSCAPALC